MSRILARGRFSALAVILLGCMGLAHAQAWPTKPVRIVVAFPPGGIVDNVARQIQPALSAALGQPVLIDNRGGGGARSVPPKWRGRCPMDTPC